jgi:alkylated DNA repair dioxygenase AlkB
VLANLYRDGRDSVGWHRDSDYAHGGRAAIASLSFGAVRRSSCASARAAGRSDRPGAGSLLLMDAGAVARWWHRVPKTPRSIGPRVNLTFRYMVAAA